MQTTYKQQMAAIKRAMNLQEKTRHLDMCFNKQQDKYWLALNDAYSTIVALRLNEAIAKAELHRLVSEAKM